MSKIFRIYADKYQAVVLTAEATEACLRNSLFGGKNLSNEQEHSLDLFHLWAANAPDGDEFWGEGFMVKRQD